MQIDVLKGSHTLRFLGFEDTVHLNELLIFTCTINIGWKDIRCKVTTSDYLTACYSKMMQWKRLLFCAFNDYIESVNIIKSFSMRILSLLFY